MKIQAEPKSDLNNAVQPSRPRMVAPTAAEELEKEKEEEDDVFDDKVPSRKPLPLSGSMFKITLLIICYNSGNL